MSGGGTPMLQGIRVLDLSQFIPGPYCTMLLSDLGADVVKVEPPHGDPQATDGPLDEDGISLWYRIINRNKRIVTLDLKSDEGRAMLRRLVAVADVLLESYRPGVLARLGFDTAELALLNGRLVHCALSGWGQSGPKRLRTGHDNNYQASMGILDVSGTLADPVTVNPPLADYAGALNAFALISAALFRRERTGQGAYIDIGMADAALALLGPEAAALAHPAYDVRRGRGPYAGGWACYNLYRCACGGHVSLGALEPRFWANFCVAVGRLDWTPRQHEPRPQTGLIAELSALFATHTRAEWVAALGAEDACFHEALTLGELETSEQIAARAVFKRGDDGFVDVLLPAWLDGAPPPERRPYIHNTVDKIADGWAAPH